MGVILTGFVRCENDAQAAKVRAFVDEHIRLTRAEPGCVSFEVKPTDDPLVWFVSEEFVDSAAFEAHQARTKASDWAVETAGIPREYNVTGLK